MKKLRSFDEDASWLRMHVKHQPEAARVLMDALYKVSLQHGRADGWPVVERVLPRTPYDPWSVTVDEFYLMYATDSVFDLRHRYDKDTGLLYQAEEERLTELFMVFMQEFGEDNGYRLMPPSDELPFTTLKMLV